MTLYNPNSHYPILDPFEKVRGTMNKKVERFATVYSGKIISITDNCIPPHELKPNQFEISRDEFKLLGNIESLEQAEIMIKSLKKRLKEIK